MSQLIMDFGQKYNEISEMLDDAVEDGDFPKVRKIVDSLFMSKIPPPCIVSFLNDCMDTAYRGTKVDPPVKECFAIVEYLRRLGASTPTYEFHAKKIN